MSWTEPRLRMRRAGWPLMLCAAVGCSGHGPAAPAAAAPEAPAPTGTQPAHAEPSAKEAEETRLLGVQWASLAEVLPGETAAIQERLDAPRGAPAARADGGIDLDAARIGLRRCEALWSKAQAAFAAGNMTEAVGTAIAVKSQLDDLATTLRLDAPARGG